MLKSVELFLDGSLANITHAIETCIPFDIMFKTFNYKNKAYENILNDQHYRKLW